MQVELYSMKGEKNYRAKPFNCRGENIMGFYSKAIGRVDLDSNRHKRVYSDMRRGSSKRTVDKTDTQPEGEPNGVLYAREAR